MVKHGVSKNKKIVLGFEKLGLSEFPREVVCEKVWHSQVGIEKLELTAGELFQRTKNNSNKV